jgi:thiamine biosynthesis lipoprotein
MTPWHTLRFDFRAMASPCSLLIDGTDEPTMRQAASAAIEEVRRIEHKYSRYRDDSILSRINLAAGARWTEVDDETDNLLDFAHRLWLLSDGLFDVTSGVLRHAWDFKAERLPEAAALRQLLSRVGWQHVAREGKQIRLEKPGMELDFGGFGKEYAADRAAAVLHSHHVRHALVNLGGDLHALSGRGVPGSKEQPWHIDIQHPRPLEATPNQPLASLALVRGGLATSGDYERFFTQQGQRYCHVLNPKTGWPVNQVQSISVLAANTTAAGALSTIAMLKGEQALAWLKQQGVSYLLADVQGQLHRNACEP